MAVDNVNTIKKEKKMTNNKNTEQNKTIKSPIDIIKRDYLDAIMAQETNLRDLNFMSPYYIKLDENFTKPSQQKTFVTLGDRIYSVKFEKNSLILWLVSNFSILDAKAIRYICNDDSNTKTNEYYVIELKNCNGNVITNIEIQANAKYDINAFQSALSQVNFCQMEVNSKEFKSLVDEYINPKLKKTVTIYKNPGLIAPQTFLYKNALVHKGIIYWADKDNLIQTADKNLFIKLDEDIDYPSPILYKSDKDVKEITLKLLINYCECWGANTTLALLATGHMIMGLFYKTFIKKTTGAPILIISGITGCGKSTLTSVGVSIFGFDEDFLSAGDSSIRGQEGMANDYNCVNICMDDLLDKILESAYFGSTIKKQFKASKRVTRKPHNKGANIIKPNSQIIYSTNGALPEIPELANRANLISIMSQTLDEEKFEYFGDNSENRKELSLILPELLKFTEDEVLQIHSNLIEKLKNNLGTNSISRIYHNIAYMWTGIVLLEKIADTTISYLEPQIFEYAKNIEEHYKEIPSPIDMLLNGLVVLRKNNIISDNIHYKIKGPENTDDARIYLIFHKDTLLTTYNKYFAGDETRKIKRTIFNNYLASDKRVIRNDLTGYYNGERKNSVMLDITNWGDVEEFVKTIDETATNDKTKATAYSGVNSNSW